MKRFFLLAVIFSLLINTVTHAQTKTLDVLPYINDIIGRPYTYDSDKMVRDFATDLRTFHGGNNDFPIEVERVKKKYGGWSYISEIILKIPNEKGEYYYPLKISLGEFSLPGKYEYLAFMRGIERAGGTFNSRDDITLPGAKYTLTLGILEEPFTGKIKKSPHFYVPYDGEYVIKQMTFKSDKNQNVVKARFAEYFAEKAKKKYQLTDDQMRLYKLVFYKDVEKHLPFNTSDILNSVNAWVIPQLKNLIEKEKIVTADNVSFLGDNPPVMSNLAVIRSDETMNCIGGPCYEGKQEIKYPFGTFEGDFVYNHAVQGTFTCIDGSTYVMYSRDQNGIMDSILFHSKLYDYTAVLDAGSYTWNSTLIISNKEDTITGQMLSLDGKLKGNHKKLLPKIFTYNFNFGIIGDGIELAGGRIYRGGSFTDYRSTFTLADTRIRFDDRFMRIYSPSQRNFVIGTSLGEYGPLRITIDSVAFFTYHPEYRNYLEILAEILQKQEFSNTAMLSPTSYDYHMSRFDYALKKSVERQWPFLSDCFDEERNYQRFNSSVKYVRQFAEYFIISLETLYEMNDIYRKSLNFVPGMSSEEKQNILRKLDTKEKKYKAAEIRIRRALKVDRSTVQKHQIRSYLESLSLQGVDRL